MQSVILYGAPVWCDALVSSKSSQRVFNRIQRTLAIRVMSAYRTVSCEAASLLARIPPFYMLATCRRRVYEQIDAQKWRDDWTTQAAKEIKFAESLILERQWKIHLSNPSLYGKHILEVINPNFEEWIARSHGRLGYYLTQFLTGHGLRVFPA
ncbi:reverse transcriptase [Lasius niger]|uniref:Reverse transcriptase n=1 Tax=Lasius niger TaxID=67767 RepID=A0A0J7NGE8_LASNI|nr:reverse transcriptase [Lasius niger]